MARGAPSCFETPRHSASKTRVDALKARLLSMRAGRACILARRSQQQDACLVRVKINLRVQKKGAEEVALFPACSLQGTAQLERVSGYFFFFAARRFFGGGLYTMPSSFMPSGSVK
jgi:hypothetical protein